jgi:hypothetical protein
MVQHSHHKSLTMNINLYPLHSLKFNTSITHLRRYATSWVVAGSSPDEVIHVLQFTESFQPHYEPEVCVACNWNENHTIFLRVNRTAICEPTV